MFNSFTLLLWLILKQRNELLSYKKIKLLIPNTIKFPLWWLFKSPQRELSFSTILNDVSGIFYFLYRKVVPKSRLQPVSICTGISNRSENYLKHTLESINLMSHSHLIEISVYDCGSTDMADLENEILKRWNGRLVYTRENIKFSRSYAFNKAIEQCSNEIIFICDADMSLPKNLVELCNAYTGAKRVWYPIYFFLFPNKQMKISKENGTWEQYGSKGMFAALKSSFNNVGRFNETFTTWGHEDTELWERFHKAGFCVIRNRQQQFFHHWHPTFNPKYAHLNEQ